MKMNKAKRLLKKRIIIMLDKGTAKEEIIKKAEKVGWKKENIEEIFKQLEEKKKDEKEIKVKVPFLKKKKKQEETTKEQKEPEETTKETTEEPEEPKKKGLVGQLKELNEKIDIISDKKKQEKKLKKRNSNYHLK